MTTAIALPVLFAAVGMATDYATLYSIRTDLQAAADGASIAAAREFAIAGIEQDKISAAIGPYLAHEITSERGPYTYSATVNTDNSTVSVRLEMSWSPFFAHFLDVSVTPVVVGATARFMGSSNLCVLTLDPTTSKALHLDKRARLNGKSCSIYSNSAHAQGIRLDQDSTMSAGHICSVGGVTAKTTAISPQPVTDCPAVPDPLSSRPSPAAKGCDESNLVIKSQNRTLSPGVYCGGLRIDGTANVTFTPGTYIIEDGPFSIAGTSTVEGNDVGFYLSGKTALLAFTGGSSIRLSGPETGEMAGLLFFEDRSASFGRVHRINSNAVRELTGTIYLPRGKLLIDPNASVAEESAYTAIVSYQLELTEGPELVLKSDYDSTHVPIPQGIKAASQIVLVD